MVALMGYADPLNAVHELSRLWPKDRSEPEASVRARLNGKVADDLSLPSLRTAPGGGWTILASPAIRGEICKCAISEGKYPFACVMVEMHQRDSGWFLTSFEPQCPVCFGTGINNGCLCDFCFGIGWGVRCHEYESNDAVTKAIEWLILSWPKNNDEPEAAIRSRLRGRIADSLPRSSIRTVAAGAWRVACPPLTYSGKARCLLVDANYPKTRALIELYAQSDDWLLTALDAECPVCFGTGINNNCICDLCFGVGWGTR